MSARNILFASLGKGKYRRRALTVLANAANGLMVPALNLVVSYWVIRLGSSEVWGELVQRMLLVQLGAHLIAWGNKEYLLREFSRFPTHITAAWQSSFLTRLVLFILFSLVIGFLARTPLEGLWMIVWGLGLVLVQSSEVLVLYRQDFSFALGVEVASTLLLGAGVYFAPNLLNVEDLLTLFGGVSLIKGLVFTLHYRKDTLGRQSPHSTRLDLQFFRIALPFFLLGFSGMLQSRLDLYVVNYYLPNTQVAHYQIFTSLMLYLQALGNFVLLPFVKNLYRLKSKQIQRISLSLSLFGCVVIPPAVGLAALVLHTLYQIDFSLHFYFLGGLLVFPVYVYIPLVYILYKENRQTHVLGITLSGLLINFILNLLLLPRFGMSGSLSAAVISQWFILTGYAWATRKMFTSTSEVAL